MRKLNLKWFIVAVSIITAMLIFGLSMLFLQPQKEYFSADAEDKKTYHLVSGFNSADVMDNIRWSGFFNSYAQFNTDKRFVSEGEGSIKLVLNGFENSTIYMECPSVMFWYTAQGFFEANRNPRQYKELSVDLFNAGANNFTVHFVLMDNNYNRIRVDQVIVPGWNTVKMDMSDQSIDSVGLQEMIQINLYTENPQAGESSKVFYMDNLKFIYR